MGPKINIVALELLYNGLFQIDFQNTETKEQFRSFISAKELFGLIGGEMEKHHKTYMKKNFNMDLE